MLVEVEDPTEEELEAVRVVMDMLDETAHRWAEAHGQETVASAILSYAFEIEQNHIQQQAIH